MGIIPRNIRSNRPYPSAYKSIAHTDFAVLACMAHGFHFIVGIVAAKPSAPLEMVQQRRRVPLPLFAR